MYIDENSKWIPKLSTFGDTLGQVIDLHELLGTELSEPGRSIHSAY